MKLALSTSWFKINEACPKEIVNTLESLGIKAVEVDYRLTELYLKKIKSFFKKKSIEVVSVHNFLPWPSDSPFPGGDAFSLSSLDRDEWESAVKYTVRSMEESLDLESRAVVLHLGKVDFSEGREFYKSLPRLVSGNGFPKIPQNLLAQRAELAPAYLDRLKLALDRLLLVAERYELFLGVENRYHFYEIPSFDEVKHLLFEFEGSNLYYWHDVGHAEINARLGFPKNEEYLKEFKNWLLGFHLHDVRGFEDHFAPFSGEVDWKKIASYFTSEAVMVVEAHPKVSQEELQKGFDSLELFFKKGGQKDAYRNDE